MSEILEGTARYAGLLLATAEGTHCRIQGLKPGGEGTGGEKKTSRTPNAGCDKGEQQVQRPSHVREEPCHSQKAGERKQDRVLQRRQQRPFDWGPTEATTTHAQGPTIQSGAAEKQGQPLGLGTVTGRPGKAVCRHRLPLHPHFPGDVQERNGKADTGQEAPEGQGGKVQPQHQG